MMLTSSERQLLNICNELHDAGIEVRHKTIMDRYNFSSSWLTELLASLKKKGALKVYSRNYYTPTKKAQKSQKNAKT